MTSSIGKVSFACFNYSDETSGNWSETLQRFVAEGYSGISSYLLWGAHERLRGTRDFSKSSRLRLEKFLKLIGDAGLELELKIGFPALRESHPAWTIGSGFLQTVLPGGIWPSASDPLSLLRAPSL